MNWNEQAIKEVEEKGRDALSISKYRASKSLGERGEPIAVLPVSTFIIHHSGMGLLREEQEQNRLGACGYKPTFREYIHFPTSYGADTYLGFRSERLAVSLRKV